MNDLRLLKVIEAPHISEKTARLEADHNQYVFQVVPDATKREVAAAVEELFEVRVTGVQVVSTRGKKKGFGMIRGFRPGWKKAYVRLAEGQHIDVMSGAE